jgi:N-acetylglucosaminyldiphosphoundecaprenol N-acetyl-beta-D-mannosaminyltransferase
VIRPVEVLTARLLPIGAEEAGAVAALWAEDGEARSVCAANVHMVMEAWDDPAFSADLRGADLAVCDGRPLVWACRRAGVADALQCRGLDLLHAVCERAARRDLAVGLYGATARVNAIVRTRLETLHPGLRVTYAWSPPFRDLSTEEDAAVVAEIAAAGVQVLFVSLGCPKQEKWMLSHRGRLRCVTVGVGAAFDMVAGDLRIAPRWIQVAGLEWAFRLALEPRRLWRRYARHNLRFLGLVLGRHRPRPTD